MNFVWQAGIPSPIALGKKFRILSNVGILYSINAAGAFVGVIHVTCFFLKYVLFKELFVRDNF